MTESILAYLRRNMKTATPLVPLITLAMIISSILLQSDGLVSASQLFQSPVSPVQEQSQKPTPEKVLPPSEPIPAKPTPVPLPTQPPATQPPVPPEPVELPTQPPQPEPTQPAAQPTETPTAPPPIVDVPSPAQPAPAYPGGAEIVIDSGLLIDSLLVYVAYAWLCCGVLIFIMIPIGFLLLYVWGAQRAKNNGG